MLYILFFVFTSVNLFSVEDHTLEEAYHSYQMGENAKTIVERKENFNRALALYSQLENKFQPDFGNGKLFYNLANSYFQVEEYPSAVYFYHKALKLMPRSDKTKQNLIVAQQKAGIPASTFVTLYDQIFFFHTKFSLPERLRLFFIVTLILITLISWSIWKSTKKFKTVIILAVLASGTMFTSILYTGYFAPIEAVVIESTPLYRDAGTQYATVSELPILGGNVIQVLAIQHEGQWLKIFSPNGDLGYVPSKSVKII